MRSINIKFTQEELETLTSSLLFSSSVNVIMKMDSHDSLKYIELAEKLKTNCSKLELKDIQFIQEENYEDLWSHRLYENFKDNIEIVSLDQV